MKLKIDELDTLVLAEQKLKGLEEVLLAITEAPIALDTAPMFLYHALDDIREDISDTLDQILERKNV